MSGLKIAVIGGGSSYTPELIEGFIKRKEALPVDEIYLVDVEDGAYKLETVGKLAQRMIEKAGLQTKVKMTFDRREAIKDADFVMTQLRVGGLSARARDERIPLKYDCIGQETTGAGGFAKAMRTIPVMLDICKDIEELAPDAWMMNFTNPAGLVSEAINKYTKVKTIGLCNVPVGMRNNIAQILEVESECITIDFAGLNHLVWGRNVYQDGENITDKVIDALCDGASMTMKNIPDLMWEPTFLRALNMVPCPYHRYFYMSDQMLADEKEHAAKHNEGTRAEQVMQIEDELFKIYEDVHLNVKPAQLEKRGGAYYSDAALNLVSAIYNDKKEIHPVNVLNKGAISNLPDDVVVEINAVIDRQGAHPIGIGKLPEEINGLIQVVKSYELLAVEAGVHGDYYAGIKALAMNPLVDSIEKAKKILDDILKENQDFLPQFEKIQ